MLLCVYESDTMQTLKCLTKRTYEFIGNWIQLQNSELCCWSIKLPSHKGPGQTYFPDFFAHILTPMNI